MLSVALRSQTGRVTLRSIGGERGREVLRRFPRGGRRSAGRVRRGPQPSLDRCGVSDPVRRSQGPTLPAGVQLGEVPGVDVDANGHVFVFHRPGRGFEPDATEPLTAPAVLEIDADTGKLIEA